MARYIKHPVQDVYIPARMIAHAHIVYKVVVRAFLFRDTFQEVEEAELGGGGTES